METCGVCGRVARLSAGGCPRAERDDADGRIYCQSLGYERTKGVASALLGALEPFINPTWEPPAEACTITLTLTIVRAEWFAARAAIAIARDVGIIPKKPNGR